MTSLPVPAPRLGSAAALLRSLSADAGGSPRSALAPPDRPPRPSASPGACRRSVPGARSPGALSPPRRHRTGPVQPLADDRVVVSSSSGVSGISGIIAHRDPDAVLRASRTGHGHRARTRRSASFMVQRSDRWRPYRMVVLSRRRFGARDQDPRWFLRFARPLDRWRQPCTAWLLPVGLRARCWRPGYRSGSHLVHRDYLPLGGGRGTAPAAVVLVPPADRA